MRNVVSISLPDDLLNKVKKQTKKENATLSEVVKKALNEYLFKTEFANLRRKALTEAIKRGIRLTDEEIFKEVS